VSAAASTVATTLRFDDDREVDLEQQAVFASLAWRKSPRWGFSLSLGALLDGTLTPAGGVAGDVGEGLAVSLGASWLPIYEGERTPFLSLAFTFASSFTSAVSDDGERADYQAFDARLEALTGKSFLDQRLTAYAAGRVFGGPVLWRLGGEDATGTDTHKYAVGGGLIVRLPWGGVDVFAEAMPLGERSYSAGAGIMF
jgi:hypothetical protein